MPFWPNIKQILKIVFLDLRKLEPVKIHKKGLNRPILLYKLSMITNLAFADFLLCVFYIHP